MGKLAKDVLLGLFLNLTDLFLLEEKNLTFKLGNSRITSITKYNIFLEARSSFFDEIKLILNTPVLKKKTVLILICMHS